MSRDRLDAIIDRLDALLAESDDPEHRKEIREIQQLVIGVREDRPGDSAAGNEDTPEDGTGATRDDDADGD